MTMPRRFLKRVVPDRVLAVYRKQRRGAGDSPRSSGRARRRARDDDRMIALGVRLWSTDARVDADVLESALKATPEGSNARAHGTLALARWYLFHGEVDAALDAIAKANAANRPIQEELDLLWVDCLIRRGRAREALGALARLTGRHSDDPTLTFRAALARLQLEPDAGHGSGPVVEALNAIYRPNALAMMWRSCVARPVGIANLGCVSPRAEPIETSPLVTVVTWLDEGGDVPVLEALCRQSWSNMEILVLTGSTPPDTTGRDRMTIDPRVSLIDRDPGEVSPIAAAVEHGTGEFVAVQPPGSWVHCQRIELQAAAMVADPGLRGTIASHMIVGRELRPRSLGRAEGLPIVGPGPQLTMLRVGDCSAAELAARFDTVRDNASPVTGEVFPPDGMALVHVGVPLALWQPLAEVD